MWSIALGQQAAVFHQRRAPPPFRYRDRRYAFYPELSSARKPFTASVAFIPRRDATLGFDTAFRWDANSSRLRPRDTVRSISPQSSSNEETSKEEDGDDGSSSPSSREKVELLFTCNQCGEQSRKKVNFLSLQKGTVFLQVMQVAKLSKPVLLVLFFPPPPKSQPCSTLEIDPIPSTVR